MGQFSNYSSGTSFTTWVSPATPSITSPTASQTNVDRNPTITASAFSSPDGFTHTSSDWQIATDSGFSSVVWSDTGDTTNKTGVTINTTNGTFAGVLSGLTQLGESTGYYVRVRYTDSNGATTAYATAINFTTRAASVNFNSEMVKEYPKGITDCQKPGMTAVTEATPSAAKPEGSIRLDIESSRFYWRINSAWKSIGDQSLYAVTALSNLASVAINTSLVSDTDSTDDLGSASKYWANTYTDKIFVNSTATMDGTVAGQITINAAIRANGAFNESATDSGFYAGGPTTLGTPRFMLCNGNASQSWQFDNNAGNFRIFVPGTTRMQIDTSGQATIYEGLTVNENASTGSDFRVESATEPNMVFVDANADTDGATYIGGTTNGTKFPKGGKQIMVGTARIGKEVRIEAHTVHNGSSAPTETTRLVGASGGVELPVIQFSKTIQQDVYFVFHAPTDMDFTTPAIFNLMWQPGASWTTGNFMWKLEYLVKDGSGATLLSGTPTTISADITPANATTNIETAFTGNITLAAEQEMICHFYRDVANDNGDDVGSVGFFELHYTANKLGE